MSNRWDPALFPEFDRLYAEGVSYAALAEKFSCSEGRIRSLAQRRHLHRPESYLRVIWQQNAKKDVGVPWRYKTPWTPDRVDLVAQLRRQGVPISAIATRLGGWVSADAVMNLCVRRGLPRGKRAPKVNPASFWTAEKIERVRQLREAGAEMKHIAKDLGTSKNAVNGVCRRWKLKKGSMPKA